MRRDPGRELVPRSLEWYGAAAIYYLVLVSIFMVIQAWFERRYVWASQQRGSAIRRGSRGFGGAAMSRYLRARGAAIRRRRGRILDRRRRSPSSMALPPQRCHVLEAIDVHRDTAPIEVLRGVSFGIGRGEVKAILGPSGSGKSTLLRCLALLEPLDGGEVRLEGSARRRPRRRRWPPRAAVRVATWRGSASEFGMVFQRFNLFPHLTALGNVMIGLTEVRGRAREDARVIAETMLERVGLGHRRLSTPPSSPEASSSASRSRGRS